jgi:ribonuclease HII
VQYEIGIDEAGRGALAGPICVGAVLVPRGFDWQSIFRSITKRGVPRLRDSKQLSAQQREIVFNLIENHGSLRHSFALVSADTIDEIGISNAAREAAAIALGALGISAGRAKVLLDAGLSVSSEWEQESFVRGDENIPAIALASIVAKVSRDRFMDELAESYVQYRFEKHKGYGTAEHYSALHIHGVSPAHRKSFVHLPGLCLNEKRHSSHIQEEK